MIVGFATPPHAERINLDVDVSFSSEGTMIPRKVHYERKPYYIANVVEQKLFSPAGVPCVDPIEYTTIIRGKRKKLYFERSTNTWFSVKWIPKQYFPVCAFAQH